MPFAFRPHRRSGLTLVEILIALTMTLIVLGTMMTAFKFASEKMQDGRALIELANRARLVEDHLRTDLGNLTVETRVYNETVEPTGYFEYIEGPFRDSFLAAGTESFQGDCDDLLCFTARSTEGVLFRGRRKQVSSTGPLVLAAASIEESSLAEIAWFTTVNDTEDGPLQPQTFEADGVTPTVDFNDSIRVHRRVLLIRPDFGTVASNLSAAEVNNFIRNNDISVRVVLNGGGATFDVIANDLNDLAIRANRFAHQPMLGAVHYFPNNLSFATPTSGNPNISVEVPSIQNRVASDDDQSVDYGLGQTWQASPPILSDVGAFDMKAYSPTARVNDVVSVIVEPSDPGYVATPANLVQRGAYVDLGYGGSGLLDEWFISASAAPTSSGANTWIAGVNVWDTWTPIYERDGIDQDNAGVVDQGTNGVDNGGSNIIDDPGERETNPPYLQPIRGMKITLRLVEKGTKQVHQVSIIHSFVPE
ncbi:prepilin-type N-terminal cleavage/methylation domain-containing protein [Mariniblastus sp.]|nr:prepilin-type N-terminal cleavage/methylation domain-containing protein [Mariniblastus sp.]